MHAIVWWPTVTMVSLATFTDLRSRRIPNWLVLPFLVGGFALSTYLRGWAGRRSSLSGFVLAILVSGVLIFLRALGMGDLKLCAAIGAWIGPTQLQAALLFTGLAGGVLALIWSLCGGRRRDLIQDTRSLLVHFIKRGITPHPELTLDNPGTHSMPYAPAIAIGTLLSFVAG
jgi:prepilin peptidase CpaA